MKNYKLTALLLAGALVFAGCSSKTAPDSTTGTSQSASEKETVQENEEATGDFTYEVSGDSIVLTGYTGTEENLYIPATIDGKPVTEIGESCFAGNIHLRKVHVPEGVSVLNDYAFECCSLMEKAYLPESLTKIGTGAFSGCGYLNLLDIQDNVEEIGDGAFLYCRSLKVFNAPAALKTLGEFALAGCEGLYEADFSASRITEVPGRTFYRNQQLMTAQLPDTVTRIGVRAFSTCPAIRYFYLPEGVTEIDSYAFEFCDALASIDIRGGEVAPYAFRSCYGMNSVCFAEAPTVLHENAFAETNLHPEEMYIPEGFITIEDGAFPNENEDYNNEEFYDEEFYDEDPVEDVNVEDAFVDAGENDDEFVDEAAEIPEWDDIKTLDEILADAEKEGYKVLSNDDFDAWADAYCEANKDTAILDRYQSVYISMYKGQIEGYFQAMTAAASKSPDDIAAAYNKHGDDFIPMYEVVNHGLHTEMNRFKMTDNMLLLTGVYESQLKTAAGTTETPTMEELKALVGTTFTDPCLTSTTNDVNVAVHFSDTLFIIYAPAESINAVGSVCMDAYMHTPENETLLFSGTEYEILDAGYFSYDAVDDITGKEQTAYEKYVLLKLINQ